MAPPILFLKDVHLNFGATPLLEGADLAISAGERMCLVGRNGSGKSTLLKVAAGQVEADNGERFVQPGTTIRYLPQEPDLTAYKDVLSYVEAGLAPGDDPYRAHYLLEQLKLSGEEDPKVISGGEARRAALARTLAPEPDILLLDEPTNHLDLPVIEWLEQELRSLRSAMVIISHDRRFLENLSRKTLWIDRGETREIDKGFAHFEDWRDEFLEQEELDRHKLDRKIVREEHWVVHGVSGRRKRNMKRLGDLGSLRKERSEQKKVAGDVKISVAEAGTSGKLVAKVKNIAKSFGDRAVVKPFSTIIARGDRLGIVGPNGAGKTTLLNMLTDKLEPDQGTVQLGANLDILVLDQKRAALDPNWTLGEALTDGSGDMVAIGENRKHVIAYMKDFLFTPEQVRTPIHALSGGERGRLMLARGLRLPSNYLVLDEPTNDLDLETLDLLQEMVADYPGTVIVVSHDRDFLDRVSTSIIASDGDGDWVEYVGGYSDMVAQRDGAKAGGGKRDKAGRKPKDIAGKLRKSASKGKLSFKHKFALENLPKKMDELSGEIERLNKALTKEGLFEKQPEKFNQLATKLAETETKHAKCEDEWLELELLREELEG